MPPDAPRFLADWPLVRRMLAPVVSFVLVAAVATAGNVLLVGVGVVEATYWLVSPDSVALYFRGRSGPERAAKALAVLTRLGLVLSGLWIGQTVVAALFGGQIREAIQHVNKERKIDTLSDHVVICGYGMFGETIVDRLDDNGTEFVIVERESEASERAERHGHPVVTGDARRESVLDRAGATDAGTVVAAVDDSNVNIQIGIVARQLASEGELVVRVGDELYEPLAERAGADTVVIPEVVSGEDVAKGL